MGATEEQMALLANVHVSHVSYILILFSVAFLMFLFVSMLLQLYANFAWPLDASKASTAAANGRIPNGHIPGQAADRRVRDAEEFELEGLMSDEDGDQTPTTPGRKKENGTI